MGILSLIGAKGLAYLGAALVAIAGIVAVYLRGGSDAKTRQKLRQANEYAETRRKADDADIVGDSPNLAREWLREFHKRHRDL